MSAETEQNKSHALCINIIIIIFFSSVILFIDHFDGLTCKDEIFVVDVVIEFGFICLFLS